MFKKLRNWIFSNTEFPSEIHCMIPAEKEYDEEIFVDRENCYLAKVLKNLGYKNFVVYPSQVCFTLNNEKILYKIKDSLSCIRIIHAFTNNECIHIKLIKL